MAPRRTIEPSDRDSPISSLSGNIPDSPYCGLASIHFPSLFPNNALESGLWCRGCERAFELYRLRLLSLREMSDLVPAAVDLYGMLLGLRYRAKSRLEFLDHIKHCYCIQRLFPELGPMIEIYNASRYLAGT